MTIYDRGVEHLKAHQSRKKESILVEHGVEEHEGRIVEWRMVSKGFPKGNLMRQAREVYLITNNGHWNLLNRKGEWGQNLPPRITVDSNQQSQKRARNTETQMPWGVHSTNPGTPPPAPKQSKRRPRTHTPEVSQDQDSAALEGLGSPKEQDEQATGTGTPEAPQQDTVDAGTGGA